VVMVLGTLILPGGLASLLALGPGYVLTYLGSFVLVTILGDCCLRNQAGAALRCPACSHCMALRWGLSS
jgi:hypothetical protein